MKPVQLYELEIYNCYDPIQNKNFWKATIHVPITLTLSSFHYFIQNLINFDNDHLYDFYASRNSRKRNIQYSETSGTPIDGADYEVVELTDVYPLNRLKLYYLFDFGDCWLFEIRKTRKTPHALACEEYPRLVEDNGVKLIQYDYGEWE